MSSPFDSAQGKARRHRAILTLDDFARIETLFAQSSGLIGAARDRAIAAAFEDRPDLRAEAEALFAAHDVMAAAAPPEEFIAPVLEIGGQVGAYTLVERIGKGGMGEVFKAERSDGAFTRQVAIKVMRSTNVDPDLLRRFTVERQILASLRHPNIVTLLDAGATPGGPAYLVMELVDGTEIMRHCRERGLSLAERLHLFRTLCAAVQYAHEQGVVHRDLKPANVLIEPDGVLKVLDFGVAKLLLRSHEFGDTTRGILPGPLTPNYASPEQLRGLPVTASSDVYALGVMLHELVVGARPYETAGKPLDEVMRLVVEIDPPRPSAVRPSVAARLPYDPTRTLKGDLDAIIVRSMAKRPEDRYPSAAELAADVDRHVSGLPVTARAASFAYVARKRAARPLAALAAAGIPLAVTTAVLLTIAVGVGIAVAFVYARSSAREPVTESSRVRALAVLPLQPESAGRDDEDFRLRLTDALITQLSGLRSMAVRPLTSVLSYGAGDANVVAAGQALGVDAVLHGHAAQDGGTLRVTLRLVEAGTGAQIWTEAFEGRATELLTLQNTISSRVLSALTVRLSRREREQIDKRPTTSPQTYEAYLKGRFFWNKRTAVGYKTAVGFFEEAIRLDPTYAQAYAGLADTLALQTLVGLLPRDEGYPRATAAALKALSLDESLAEAHTSLGFILSHYDFAWDRAEQEFARAVELAPHYATAHHWRGLNFKAVGRLQEYVDSMKDALEHDPLALAVNEEYANALAIVRRCDDAVEQATKAVQMHGGMILAEVLTMCERHEEAIPLFEPKAWSQAGVPALKVLGHLGYSYARTGRIRQARETLEILKKYPRKSLLLYIAEIHGALGELDVAFDHLNQLYESKDDRILLLKARPLLDPLRGDPRFRSLLLRMNLPAN